MRIDYSRRFIRQVKKAPAPIRLKLVERIELFRQNRKNPLLHDHVLTGQWKGYRSINITGDWRAIYEKITNDETMYYFIALGTHSQLYEL